MRNLVLATVLIALGACAGTPKTDSTMIPTLAGTAWTLATLSGEAALPSPEVTLSFEGERVVGTGGVNRYFGSWSADGALLSFTAIGSTRMMGPPAAQEQEDRFLTALKGVDGARLDGEDLALTAGTDVVMTWTPR